MATLKLSTIEKQIKDLGLKSSLRIWTRNNYTSMSKLSVAMGQYPSYLANRCKKGDLRASEMILIGKYLDVNPFEMYMRLLPENVRATTHERQLETENLAFKTQLEALEKEHVWLKEVIAGKR